MTGLHTKKQRKSVTVKQPGKKKLSTKAKKSPPASAAPVPTSAPKPNPPHRPSIFTADLAKEICDRIATGQSLVTICRDAHMPDRSVAIRWLARGSLRPAEYPELADFCSMYARAREVAADVMAEELLDISDDSINDFVTYVDADGNVKKLVDQEHIQRAKLRCDNRKWLMSKLQRSKYGDKLDVDAKLTINPLTTLMRAASGKTTGPPCDRPGYKARLDPTGK